MPAVLVNEGTQVRRTLDVAASCQDAIAALDVLPRELLSYSPSRTCDEYALHPYPFHLMHP